MPLQDIKQPKVRSSNSPLKLYRKWNFDDTFILNAGDNKQSMLG
jgi:hypothetical protein